MTLEGAQSDEKGCMCGSGTMRGRWGSRVAVRWVQGAHGTDGAPRVGIGGLVADSFPFFGLQAARDLGVEVHSSLERRI